MRIRAALLLGSRNTASRFYLYFSVCSMCHYNRDENETQDAEAPNAQEDPNQSQDSRTFAYVRGNDTAADQPPPPCHHPSYADVASVVEEGIYLTNFPNLTGLTNPPEGLPQDKKHSVPPRSYAPAVEPIIELSETSSGGSQFINLPTQSHLSEPQMV